MIRHSGVGLAEFELRRAHLELVRFYQAGFVDLLVVDEGAVAARGIADPPFAALGIDDGMNTRSERVGENDVAIEAAANAVLLALVEEKLRTGPRANGHDEVVEHRGQESGVRSQESVSEINIILAARWGRGRCWVASRRLSR